MGSHLTTWTPPKKASHRNVRANAIVDAIATCDDWPIPNIFEHSVSWNHQIRPRRRVFVQSCSVTNVEPQVLIWFKHWLCWPIFGAVFSNFDGSWPVVPTATVARGLHSWWTRLFLLLSNLEWKDCCCLGRPELVSNSHNTLQKWMLYLLFMISLANRGLGWHYVYIQKPIKSINNKRGLLKIIPSIIFHNFEFTKPLVISAIWARIHQTNRQEGKIGWEQDRHKRKLAEKTTEMFSVVCQIIIALENCVIT